MIDDKEFEPEGFFGQRGIKPEVAREREYVRFEFTGTDAVFEADLALMENAGFVHWLVCGTGLPHTCGPGEIREKHGGYVIQKHRAPLPDLEHIVAQIRPETAPITEITYHDHKGMVHQKGKGCPCGAKVHRKAYTQRPYNETECKGHEKGSAHTEPDPQTEEAVSVKGPHRHTEEGRYMLNPNRERRSVPHTHRIFLNRDTVYREEVVTALVSCGGRRTNKRLASELAVSEQAVEDYRGVARHIRRPVDHRFGGHGGKYDGGLDEEHSHEKEVDYAIEVVERPHPHRVYKHHSKTKRGHRAKDGKPTFDPHCRKCVADRHAIEMPHRGSIQEGEVHPHTYTQRVNLPSTEKRLDMHPWTRKRLESIGLPSRWFFSIEGTPKNDALVSAREAAFNVPSVTMWRAPELADFAREYLTTHVYVVPDSDWAWNPLVALQAFACREFLRGILGQDEVHVAAARPKCGDVCNHSGQERKDHKRGVDDFLGEGFGPDDLIVLDRHPSYSFSEWAKDLESETRGKAGRAHEAAVNRIQVMEWLCLHATLDGRVKRSVSSIAKYVRGPDGQPVTDDTVYRAIEKLVADGALSTVPPGLDLKRITRYRRTGSKTLYLGEDYEGGVTFSIRPDLRWRDVPWRLHEWEVDIGIWTKWSETASDQVV